jgi:hypothetical protein
MHQPKKRKSLGSIIVEVNMFKYVLIVTSFYCLACHASGGGFNIQPKNDHDRKATTNGTGGQQPQPKVEQPKGEPKK